jgi:hypothetical protein
MLKFNIVKNVNFKPQAKFHFVILIWVGTAVVGRGSLLTLTSEILQYLMQLTS